MEDNTVRVKKKNKTGPLKSTPGFLKCMRSVYLYFKEEKEKGALNIPINSFIERTAVACGVGRKTLYNYAKKGLFDEHPTLLQPKQKKKRGKRKMKSSGTEELQIGKRGRKKTVMASGTNTPGPSCSPPLLKKKSPPSRPAKNAMIQTDPRPISANDNISMQSSTNDSENGFNHFMLPRDQKTQSAGTQIQVVQQTKLRETHVIAGPWSSPPAIRREIDYFSTKNNIWQTVYNIHTTDSQTCNTELNNGSRMTTCQQTTSDHLTDL